MRNIILTCCVLALFLLVGICSFAIQSGADYMYASLVWGPLPISLLLSLGSTILGTGALIFARNTETCLSRLFTGLGGVLAVWCSQAYWHLPVKTCAAGTMLGLVWSGWTLWNYRRTKDKGFNKLSTITIGSVIILGLALSLLDYSDFQKNVIAQMTDYSLAVSNAVVVCFSSVCILALEIIERKQQNLGLRKP